MTSAERSTDVRIRSQVSSDGNIVEPTEAVATGQRLMLATGGDRNGDAAGDDDGNSDGGQHPMLVTVSAADD